MSTRANINLLGRDFKLQADGHPQYVLGELFNAWEGNKEKLLFKTYEELPHGVIAYPFWDYGYEFTIKYGTLMVEVDGNNLNEIDWTEECPAWMLQEINPDKAILILSDCRYCKHLADVRPKGSRDWIGRCGLGLVIANCQKWELMEGYKE